MMLGLICLRFSMFDDNSDTNGEYLIFKQRIDHTDTHNRDRVFDQRYLKNLKYVPADQKFKKCILYIGGESTLSDATLDRNSSYNKLAEREGAALFALEHRFFGKSMPFEELTYENYKYLTISQALNDLANFINFIKQDSRASSDVRFLVVGGSYPGSLSSWFRVFYPHLAVASWSSSAPLDIKNEYPEYDSYMAEQLDSINDACLERTKTIFDNAETIFKSGDEEKKKAFKQLYEIPTDNDDVSSLYIVIDVLAAIIQYNSRYNLLDEYCKKIKDEKDSTKYESIYVETYKKLLNLSRKRPTDFDIRRSTNTSSTSPDANSRSWTWMTCNEVGWFQTASGLLRPSQLDITYFKNVCTYLFPEIKELADEEQVNIRFGGTNPRQTRVYFTNGDVDPWSTLSIHYPDESIERHTIMIPGESHCTDLGIYNESKRSNLTIAQEIIMDQMSKWLNEESCNATCNHGTCIGGRCACDEGYGGEKCDVEMTKKVYLDIAIITGVSVPVVLLVIAIFASWLCVYRPRKEMQMGLISSAN
jgi:serine protease 16